MHVRTLSTLSMKLASSCSSTDFRETALLFEQEARDEAQVEAATAAALV